MNFINRKRTIAFADILFLMIAFLGFIALVFSIFYNETILRLLSYAFYFVGYLFYFIGLKQKTTLTSVISLIFLLYIFFIWAFSGFKYDVLVASLSFFLIFSSFESAKVIKPREKLFNLLFFFYFAQGCLLILVSFSQYAYTSITNDIWHSNDLLLGLSNPNETGMILAYTIIGLFICLKKRKNNYTRLITFLVIGYLFYLLILTRARTSFVGIVLFVILSIIYRKKKGILFTNKLLFLSFIIYPILFVPLYLFYSQKIANRLSLFGKTLFSGRQEVYLEHLLMWSNKLFGNISIFHLDNAHNGLFTILLNFGIIGFVFYLIYLIRNLIEIKNNKCFCNTSRVGFIAILCLFFMSASESAFIVAGKYYYSNFLIMIWFANYFEIEEMNDEKNIINIKRRRF